VCRLRCGCVYPTLSCFAQPISIREWPVGLLFSSVSLPRLLAINRILSHWQALGRRCYLQRHHLSLNSPLTALSTLFVHVFIIHGNFLVSRNAQVIHASARQPTAVMSRSNSCRFQTRLQAGLNECVLQFLLVIAQASSSFVSCTYLYTHPGGGKR